MIYASLIDLTLNKLQHGNELEQISAASALHQCDKATNALISQLHNDSEEITIGCLNALSSLSNSPIEPLIKCLSSAHDPDVKLAAIHAISTNHRIDDAKSALLELANGDNECWDGDWDDGIDIALASVNALLKTTQGFVEEELAQLITLIHSDPEPELEQALYYLLAKVAPNKLDDLVEQEWNRSLSSPLKTSLGLSRTRKLLKASSNKVHLFKYLENDDLLIQRIALTRLSDLDAREYLQSFLSMLSSAQQPMQDIAISTLLRWQYPVAPQYLESIIRNNHPISKVLPFITKESFLLLLEQWQSGEMNKSNVASFLSLTSRFDCDLSEIVKHFFAEFGRLEPQHQIDSLTELCQSREMHIPVSFLRMHLQSQTLDNSVRLLLIKNLASQNAPASKSLINELIFDNAYIDFKSTERSDSEVNSRLEEIETKKAEVNTKDNSSKNSNLSSIKPMSTLAALSMPLDEKTTSPAKQPFKKSQRKIAIIESLTNRSKVIEYCASQEQLIELCTAISIEQLDEEDFFAIVKASLRCNLAYASIRSDELDDYAHKLLVNSDYRTELKTLVEWLGPVHLQTEIPALVELSSPLLVSQLIPFIEDLDVLNILLEHPYLGVKQQAIIKLESLMRSDKTRYIELIHFALSSPDLHSTVNQFDHTVLEEELVLLLNTHPLKALQFMGDFGEMKERFDLEMHLHRINDCDDTKTAIHKIQ
ncbi:hypothetical protein L4C37_03855 [Vibrio kagoshimensis]|uniref:HEAT repeat domain-containing protein n=1 Tax=Vibrio kagoshimensis TaxID=2910244 RepID=UPI003D1EC370